MSGLFQKLKGAASANGWYEQGSSSPASSTSTCKRKDAESELQVSLLVKMLQNAGPNIRKDGSDKFFGMENFGNTWFVVTVFDLILFGVTNVCSYCNSIVQALYYSVPFRENLINFPPPSSSKPSSETIKIVPSIRAPIQNGVTSAPNTKQKGPMTVDAIKKRAGIGSSQNISAGQRPEDKPDSPEYKKKYALMNGPVLELTYENSGLYGMEESTYTALKDIFMALIESESRTGVLSPQRFLEIFKRENEMFRTSMHQDAHEFYGLVLNSVIANVESKAREIKASTVTSNPSSHHSVEPFSPVTDGQFPSEDIQNSGSGWVHEIFEGILTSETKCLTCETVSQRDETFLDLSIDLDEHTSVTACLRKFSAEEMLCERNKFHCDNCGGLQEAERRTKIKRLPKILALHLKRFKYTEDMTQLQKLFHRVVYPYHLRIFNTTDDAEDPDRLYELYAIVVHIGGNAYHGHYVSVIKTKDRGWLLFDDEMVEPVDKHYARNFFGDKPGMACAYVLFYQEASVESLQKEQEFERPHVPGYETEELDPDLGNSAHYSTTSYPTDPTTLTKESRDGIPADNLTSASIPSNINGASSPLHSPLNPPQKPTTPTSLNQKIDCKDQKVQEKKGVKVLEEARKPFKKGFVKEKKIQVKDTGNSSFANKIPSFQAEEEQLDHQLPALSSNFESLSPPLNSSKQCSSSTRRTGFTLLGGAGNGEEKKLPITTSRKPAHSNETQGDEEHQLLENNIKLSRNYFCFIPLGRKKSSLLPP